MQYSDIKNNLQSFLQKLRDVKYATSDIDERLALARMDVANLRAALLDARDSKSVDIYAAKLRIAEAEYARILKIKTKNIS
ncbi:MAG: hypothetical protein UIL37_00775 [Clostridia bacterium]|nr:hypothetical protein [Clostridia bacterium]